MLCSIFPPLGTVDSPAGDGSGANSRSVGYRRMTLATSVADLFKDRHFDQEIIVLCVRWHLQSKLSTRDLVEMMAEHGTRSRAGAYDDSALGAALRAGIREV